MALNSVFSAVPLLAAIITHLSHSSGVAAQVLRARLCGPARPHAALCVSEYTEPYQRYIYHDSDVVRADLDGPLIPSKHPARFWM